MLSRAVSSMCAWGLLLVALATLLAVGTAQLASDSWRIECDAAGRLVARERWVGNQWVERIEYDALGRPVWRYYEDGWFRIHAQELDPETGAVLRDETH